MKYVFSYATLSLFSLLCACSSASDPKSTSDGGVTAQTCPVAGGPTVHEGDITKDEVWKAEGSPHIVKSDVNVVQGAKLVIEPCAVVQVARDANLNVAFPLTPNEGQLEALGTAEQPIKFERLDDGPWGRLFIHHPGRAKLAYVTIANTDTSCPAVPPACK